MHTLYGLDSPDYDTYWENLPGEAKRKLRRIKTVDGISQLRARELHYEDGDFGSEVLVNGVIITISGDDAFWAAKYAHESAEAKRDFFTALKETVEGDRG